MRRRLGVTRVNCVSYTQDRCAADSVRYDNYKHLQRPTCHTRNIKQLATVRRFAHFLILSTIYYNYQHYTNILFVWTKVWL